MRAFRPRPGIVDPRAIAAGIICDIEAGLRAEGRSPLDLLGTRFEPGEHYPEGEVRDGETHAQFFYHTHPDGGRLAGEHGHFHLFLGADGVPAGVRPLLLPEMALAPAAATVPSDAIPLAHCSHHDRGVFGHLIAVSLDGAGRPIGLFTTNRWVTGETWYRAEDVMRMVRHFRFSGEPGPLGRWLMAVLAVIEPDARALLADRDRVVMEWRRRRSHRVHVFDDRRLDLVTSRAIDFDALLAAPQYQT